MTIFIQLQPIIWTYRIFLIGPFKIDNRLRQFHVVKIFKYFFIILSFSLQVFYLYAYLGNYLTWLKISNGAHQGFSPVTTVFDTLASFTPAFITIIQFLICNNNVLVTLINNCAKINSDFIYQFNVKPKSVTMFSYVGIIGLLVHYLLIEMPLLFSSKGYFHKDYAILQFVYTYEGVISGIVFVSYGIFCKLLNNHYEVINQIILTNTKLRTSVNKMKLLLNFHYRLSGNICLINKLFGLIILISLGAWTSSIVLEIYYAYQSANYLIINLIGNICWMLPYIVLIIYISVICHKTQAQVTKHLLF